MTEQRPDDLIEQFEDPEDWRDPSRDRSLPTTEPPDMEEADTANGEGPMEPDDAEDRPANDAERKYGTGESPA